MKLSIIVKRIILTSEKVGLSVVETVDGTFALITLSHPTVGDEIPPLQIKKTGSLDQIRRTFYKFVE
jgi:hypothetical protein